MIKPFWLVIVVALAVGVVSADQIRLPRAAPVVEEEEEEEPPPDIGDLEDLPLIGEAQLTYLGGFRFPTADSGGDTFAYNGAGSIAYDASTDRFYVHTGYSICTITNPALVNTSNPTSMNQASFDQACDDPTDGNRQADMGNPSNGSLIGGLLVTPSFVYYSVYHYYPQPEQAQSAAIGSHARVSRTIASGGYSGFVSVWNGSHDGTHNAAGFTAIGMAPIPSEEFGGTSWQDVLGGTAVTMGCCVPIVQRTSPNGPAVFAFNAADIYTASEPITAYPLMVGHEDTWGAYGGQSEVFAAMTFLNDMALINNTRTALFIGTHGSGPFCYGDGVACGDTEFTSSGNHNQPYRYQMWAVDMSDWAAVKAGSKDWDTVAPYEVWDFTFPTPHVLRHSIIGAFYNPATKRLYVAQGRAGHGFDGSYPVMHAFSVDDTP